MRIKVLSEGISGKSDLGANLLGYLRHFISKFMEEMTKWSKCSFNLETIVITGCFGRNPIEIFQKHHDGSKFMTLNSEVNKFLVMNYELVLTIFGHSKSVGEFEIFKVWIRNIVPSQLTECRLIELPFDRMPFDRHSINNCSLLLTCICDKLNFEALFHRTYSAYS